MRRKSQGDFPPFHVDFTKELALFLQAREVCETLAEAEETVFLLMMSGKGLLMDTRSRAAFEAGMARVVAVILRDSMPAGRRTDPGAAGDDPEIDPTRTLRQRPRSIEEERDR